MRNARAGGAAGLLAAGALVLSIAPIARAMPTQGTPAAEILVEGSGEARAVPDRASFTLSVVTRASAASRAAEDNAAGQQAVLAALRDAGVPNDRLATVGYDLQPEYERREGRSRRLVGYVARTRVRVGPIVPERLGVLIDTALAAGANEIDAVRFDTSRRQELRREALAAAVHDARAAADAIAEAAGGRLGALLLVSTPGVDVPEVVVRHYRPPGMAMAAEASEATPIVAGEIVVRAQVQTRWLLERSR